MVLMSTIFSTFVVNVPKKGENVEWIAMDIKEIRRVNVQLIIKERYKGVKAKFAEAIGKKPEYVSRWFSKGSQARNIDYETARLIEEIHDLPSGWLDKLQDKLHELQNNDYFKTQLLDFYEKLSADGKHKLLNAANQLLQEESPNVYGTKEIPYRKVSQ